MITKQHEPGPEPTDPRRKAGALAEKQMAFYLHREFSEHPGLFVLNDLRIVDPNQPEFDGSPGVCQIDHLLLHRWGAFIIESKSLTGEVNVRGDGHGGQQWTRGAGRSERGFACPVQQARRQGELLRGFLQAERANLLGRSPIGTRTLVKLLHKTDQRGFRKMPIQIFIAFADRSTVHRLDGWEPPEEPFQTFVTKSDQITGAIINQYERHRKNSNPISNSDPHYGMWCMTELELKGVAKFLGASHTDRKGKQPATRTDTRTEPEPSLQQGSVCRSCGTGDLEARSGPYGYFWSCRACDANTPMGVQCTACGRNGKQDRSVRIHKQGPHYDRHCQTCGHVERVWIEARAT